MNLIRIAAGLPRRLPDIRNTSLTTRTAVVVALIGLSVWLLLDLVYQQSAQRDLSARLQQQLHTAAVTERGRIHKSLASFRATARYLANYQPLHQRLRSWNRTGTHTLPAISQWKPDWLPGTRSVDERIDLDIATVLGRGRETHALYGNGHRTVAGIFLQPDSGMLQGAMDSLRVHVEDGVAYLVSAARVQGEDGRVLGSVLIAARIDRRFLAGIVDTPAAPTVSGLVLGNRALPLALLGPAVDAARSDYRIGGSADASLIANELLLESDNGNTLRHAVWLDSRQVAALNEPVLARARQQRTLTIAVFALLLVAMIAGIARRIHTLHGAVERYSHRLGVSVPRLNTGDPIASLATRLERLSEEIIAETYMLEYQARHDSLTSLPNRALLLNHLENELQNALEAGEPLALFIMDLDRFKEVNDVCGHAVGDLLLQAVANRLKGCVREADTVARMGGDEFVILLESVQHSEDAQGVSEKIRQALAEPLHLDGHSLNILPTIGIGLYPDHGLEEKQLFKYADEAMYAVKRAQKMRSNA